MPAIFKILCCSWENLKNKNTWFLQTYQFCFPDFPKTSNNYQNSGHVFWRYTKHYSSTENQAHSMMCSRFGALQNMDFFLRNSWFLYNSQHFRQKLNLALCEYQFRGIHGNWGKRKISTSQFQKLKFVPKAFFMTWFNLTYVFIPHQISNLFLIIWSKNGSTIQEKKWRKHLPGSNLFRTQTLLFHIFSECWSFVRDF